MAGLSALFLMKQVCPNGRTDPLKDFFDTWKFKILVIVAVFLVGIMAYAGANGRLTAAPQELLSVVLTPLQKVTSALSGGAASVWEKYTSIDDVMDRNEQLEAEMQSCASRWWTTTASRPRTTPTRHWPAFRTQIPRQVMFRPLSSAATRWMNLVVLRWICGSTDGVAVNDAIISDRGYLLGVVVEVDATSCKVMTILHPSFNAAGVISRTRENGIITGSADYAADGQCVLTNLDRATEARRWAIR